jgi:hypothetical protein
MFIEFSLPLGFTLSCCRSLQHQLKISDLIDCYFIFVWYSFKYLGSILNGNNSIEEEIEGRTFLGNKAFYTN